MSRAYTTPLQEMFLIVKLVEPRHGLGSLLRHLFSLGALAACWLNKKFLKAKIS